MSAFAEDVEIIDEPGPRWASSALSRWRIRCMCAPLAARLITASSLRAWMANV